MVYGAAAATRKVMTSSSSPGISLMQKIQYGRANVPAVVVDVMRGGPGLGNIQPSQADYNQVTKSARPRQFSSIVLAPSTVQEAIDLTVLAFDLPRSIAHGVCHRRRYHRPNDGTNPIAGDGPITNSKPSWAVTGARANTQCDHVALHGREELEKSQLRSAGRSYNKFSRQAEVR